MKHERILPGAIKMPAALCLFVDLQFTKLKFFSISHSITSTTSIFLSLVSRFTRIILVTFDPFDYLLTYTNLPLLILGRFYTEISKTIWRNGNRENSSDYQQLRWNRPIPIRYSFVQYFGLLPRHFSSNQCDAFGSGKSADLPSTNVGKRPTRSNVECYIQILNWTFVGVQS